jgi:glycine/D-amino acid oxidase-like deaminating enzyme
LTGLDGRREPEPGEDMRIVIAGGGVIGLLTAISCVNAGHSVIVLDQSGIPFSGAASWDRHRALRALHLGDPLATSAAVRAHHRWQEMEQLLAIRCYQQVGALAVLPEVDLPGAHDLLASAGSRPRVIGPGQLAAAYPHIRFPAGAGAVVESLAGVLLADRVLAACADWLRSQDRAVLRPHCRVVSVNEQSPAVLLADGELVGGDAVLLATGPWSRALLPARLADQLVLHRQSMLYLQVPAGDAAAWSATPSIRSIGRDGGTWLIPPVADTPLKISAASACRIATAVGNSQTPARWREHLTEVAAAAIPGFDTSWLAGARDCHYLADASGGPVLAMLAGQVAAYAACGGGSFKFAPLIAGALTARLTGGEAAPTGLPAIDSPCQARPEMPGAS